MIMLAGGFALGGAAPVATGADLYQLVLAVAVFWAGVVTMAVAWWTR